MGYEEQLRRDIQSGNLNDAKINDILSHGDRGTKQMLEKKINDQYKAKEYYSRATGLSTKAFDGIDNNGNPYKDMQVRFPK